MLYRIYIPDGKQTENYTPYGKTPHHVPNKNGIVQLVNSFIFRELSFNSLSVCICFYPYVRRLNAMSAGRRRLENAIQMGKDIDTRLNERLAGACKQ